MSQDWIRGTRWVLAIALVALLHGSSEIASAQKKERFNPDTILMESTFKIVGPGSQGAAFVLGRPRPSAPAKLRYVLVTAAHVLEKIQCEKASLVLRRKKGELEWERFPFEIQIRTGQIARWIKHPHADVAVMYVGLPTGVIEDGRLLPMALLADDSRLAELEVHPGDELNSLGFPLGLESTPAGFPVLRSGKIASYPFLPTNAYGVFLFDFKIFDGNSGGPVYFVDSNRIYGGAMHAGTTHFLIMGLVTSEERARLPIQELYTKREEVYPLGLAKVVHASLIKEAINLLPSSDTPDH